MRKHMVLAGLIAATPCGMAAAEGRVIITEIMYNPASNERRGETEWVEIANVGDGAVEMVGWRLDDEDAGDWGTFDLKLEPGEVAVLFNKDAVGKPDAFFAAWGDSVPAKGNHESEERTAYHAVGVEWASLGNRADADNEVLQLIDDEGEVVCEVNYHSDGDWPHVNRPDGASIWLTDLAGEPSDGKLWKASEQDKTGARAVKLNEVFNSNDIGSPGFVPGLDGPVKAVAKKDVDKKKNTRKSDDEIDY